MDEVKGAAEKDKGGAPKGNQNYLKGKAYQRALKRALLQKPGCLDRIIAKAIDQAEAGDRHARAHIAERLDGKAPLHVIATGMDDGPIRTYDLTKVKPEDLEAMEKVLAAAEREESADADGDQDGAGAAPAA